MGVSYSHVSLISLVACCLPAVCSLRHWRRVQPRSYRLIARHHDSLNPCLCHRTSLAYLERGLQPLICASLYYPFTHLQRLSHFKDPLHTHSARGLLHPFSSVITLNKASLVSKPIEQTKHYSLFSSLAFPHTGTWLPYRWHFASS